MNMDRTNSETINMKHRKPVIIRQVWASNLEIEFSVIQNVIARYPIVSIDTEFPGTIFQSNLTKPQLLQAPPLYNYFLMKLNVDTLKIIQLGLTLSNSEGNLPSLGTKNCYVWQFNFRDFDIGHDPYNILSIGLLEKQGTDFKNNRENGIDSRDFAKLVLNSTLVSNKSSLVWITFHGAYDFGFLIKILTQRELPYDISGFMEMLKFFFGVRVYDMKLMMSIAGGLKGGLEKLANLLGVNRIAGRSHQAGSDSLLTMQTFLRFKDVYVDAYQQNVDGINFNGWEGMLFGLCQGMLMYNGPEFSGTYIAY